MPKLSPAEIAANLAAVDRRLREDEAKVGPGEPMPEHLVLARQVLTGLQRKYCN